MATNEAKVRFTADTTEFSAQLKNANSTLSALRAGLKLNEAELKNNGNEIDYLKNKHNLLEDELEANRQKQEALTGKLEAAKRIYGENSTEVQSWTTKLTNAKTEEQNLESALSQCETQLADQKEAAERLQTPLEQLTSKISEQQKELDKLKTDYKNVALEQGTDSEAAQDLKSQIDNLSSELNDNKKTLKNVEEAADDMGEAMEDSGESAERLQTPLEQLTSKISEQQKELDKLKTDYKNVALEQGTDSEAAQDLKSQIDNLSSELNDNKKTLENVEEAADDMGEAMEDSGESAEKSANGGWTVAKDIFADLASNAIQACIEKLKELAKETVNTTINFTSSMSNVQALSGATDEEFAQLEETARSLGASTIFSASEVADAFSYMALAGWDTSDMLEGIESVLNLAAAGDMDLAEASDIVTDYLTAFGLSAEDAGGFVDEMAYAMANSNTDVEQLGEAYKGCAATAASMGYSVEDTTAALMTMANDGVKGSDAGKGLSTVMTRLATDTSKCTSKLEEYGVEVYDSEGNLNDLSSILNGCAGIWNDLTDSEQANLAKSIAGTNQFSKFQEVMAGLNEEAEESGQSFNNYTEALEDTKNASEEGTSAAQEMADTMQDNLGGDLKELDSAFEEFQLSIGDYIEEPLREAVQYATDFVTSLQDLGDWISEHQTELTVLGAAIGVVTAALVMQSTVQAVKTAMNAAEAASLGALISTKLADAAASMLALAPYLLIAAGIAILITLIVLCVKHWDEIKEKVTEVAESIKEKITELKDKVTDKFNEIRESITEKLTEISDKFKEIWNGITSFFSQIFEKIKEIVGKIRDNVAEIFNKIKTKAQEIWAKIKENIITPIQTVFEKIKEILTKIYDKIKEKFNDVKERVAEIWENIKERIITPIRIAKLKLIDTIDDIKKGIIKKIVDIRDKAKEIFENIKEKITSPLNAAKSTVNSIFDSIKKKIDDVITKAKDIVKSGTDAIKGFFDKLKIKFPDIKLPHFSITGKFSLDPPSVPKLSIDWYAKGAVFNAATIIPTLSGLKGVGEAEPEAVSPISVLQDYVTEAVENANSAEIDYDRLGRSVAKACANMNIRINLNNREFGRAVRSCT